MGAPRDRDGQEIPDVLLPRGLDRLYRRSRVARLIARHFARLYYYNADRTIFQTAWLGHTTLKYPTDLWVYQEIVAERRPDLIVETGTWRGGSALFLGAVCDAIGHGEVISIDLHEWVEYPAHPRVTYLTGSSVSPEVVDAVRDRADRAERVLVILDSDHRGEHVLAELRAYADIVEPGSYVIVEDTNINGHPVLPEFGSGPMEAADAFLAEETRFVRDPARERLFLTANPRGFLRRER